MDNWNSMVNWISSFANTWGFFIMNNKAQVSVVAFMLAIVIVILALSFAFPVNEITTDAQQNGTNLGEVGGMQCNNASISDYNKVTCWISDIGQAYFIGAMFALAGVVIAARVIWG